MQSASLFWQRYTRFRETGPQGVSSRLRYKGIVTGDRQELIRALTLFSERGLNIVDCILCAKAVAGGKYHFTFDADLIKKLARRA